MKKIYNNKRINLKTLLLSCKIRKAILQSILTVVVIISITCCGVGCKKFIEVDPPYTSINGGNVYTTDATAISAVTSMYTKLGNADGNIETQIISLTYCAGISADELTLTAGVSNKLLNYYTNSLNRLDPPLFFSHFYDLVYLTNSSIEGLSVSTTLTPAVKQQLLGEAKFMRAFSYFYLVNLYGDVPLVLSTDYKKSSLMSRTPATDVWQQIISDLVEAKDLLNSNYVGADVITSLATTERLRPNKWTASALLARAYLYTNDYANAETEATGIINNTSMYSLAPLSSVFLKAPAGAKEAIWQIQTITTGRNTNDAVIFILPASGPNTFYPVYLNKKLVYDFEAGDSRKTNWINGIKVGVDSFYYAYKYKSATLNAPVTEYNTPFRLAEQYLIRAEARAMQNKFQGAIDDVNTIRNQHGGLLTPLPAPTSQSEAINLILHERRVELFAEWGHRWLDLKRTNTVDAVMNVETPLKGGTWQSYKKLYPIATTELTSNPNLTQTPGY